MSKLISLSLALLLVATAGAQNTEQKPVTSSASGVANGDLPKFNSTNANTVGKASANVDYAKSVRATAADTTALAWPAGVTVWEQSPALTANRTATLPAANTFASGTIIRYVDAATTGNFGRGFIPATGDTLDGLSVAGVGGSGLTYFKKGGLDAAGNASNTFVQFQTDGTSAWKRLALQSVKGGRDPTSGYAWTFDASAMAANGAITIAGPGPWVIPRPASTASGEAMTAINTDGSIAGGIWGLPDPTLASEGDIATVSGGTWINAAGGGSGSPWVPLTAVGTVITWTPIAGQRIQNAYVTLTGDRTLDISGATLQSGMTFNLVVIQDGTGGRKLTGLPYQMKTGSNGLGLLQQTTAANAADWYEFNYAGAAGLNWVAAVKALNMTAATIAGGACSTAGQGYTTGTNSQGATGALYTYISSSFVAQTGNTSICRVDANLWKAGTVGFALHWEIRDDAVINTVTDAVTTTGSSTVSSVTSNWTSQDRYKHVVGTGIPNNTYIGQITDTTHIVLSSTRGTHTAVAITGTGTTISMQVFGKPGNVIGTGSTNEPNAGGLPTTATGAGSADDTPTSFTGLSTTLTVGQVYHMVLKLNGTPDATNNVKWLYGTATNTGEQMYRSQTGTSWVYLGTDRKARYQAYH